MKRRSVAELKREEARQRMAALQRAGRSRRAALVEQRRASLVDGSQGRITNLPKVMRAMAKWAKAA